MGKVWNYLQVEYGRVEPHWDGKCEEEEESDENDVSYYKKQHKCAIRSVA